jgi:hypothetical protein
VNDFILGQKTKTLIIHNMALKLIGILSQVTRFRMQTIKGEFNFFNLGFGLVFS